jgi:hypothetical protein
MSQFVQSRKETPSLLLVTDSANQIVARRMMELREELVQAGYQVLYPCPHQLHCPMLDSQRDWCYSEAAWELPTYQKRIDHLMEVRREVVGASMYLFASPGLNLTTKANDPVVVGLNLVAPSVGPYAWGGFLAPTRTLPTLTTAAAGFTANVRFSLGGNMGLGILKSGSPLMRLVDCTTLAPLGSLASTIAVAPLTYVASTASYSYFWRTDRTWAGSCRELVLRFIDGSQQRAVYRFQ